MGASMTTDQSHANAYLRTKVMTSSPEELRLMLIEGAIRFTRVGREGLVNKDYERVYEGFTRAKDILMELINALRPEVDPELCKRLSALYTFMYRRLMDASLEKNPAIADEVLDLLEYERETWVMLMDKVAKERAGAGGPNAAPEQPREHTATTFTAEG